MGKLPGAGCEFYAGDQAVEKFLTVCAGIFHSRIGTERVDGVEPRQGFVISWSWDVDAVDKMGPVLEAVTVFGAVFFGAVPAGRVVPSGVEAVVLLRWCWFGYFRFRLGQFCLL